MSERIDLDGELEVAMHAAREAGKALAARGEAFAGVASSKGRDIKLNADKAAEDIIFRILAAGAPRSILSEETGWTAEADDYAWVVDPLDGSANYNNHIPLCCVSIALVQSGAPVLGVLYDFNNDQMYSGIVGRGAWLNGRSISVSETSDASSAILMTGLAVNRDFSAEALARSAADFARWKKVRMIGSAATSLSYVAAGKADCYFEENIMFWDVAAGCAIVTAAGGRVNISDGPLDAPKVVKVDNGKLE
ncbi:MAG: inositol monophosphatase family protein [Maricaulis sp.]|uniref:inositol monophosphatase family protein n=1 Tax=Maricaulis sp. TaxID=1486257 RepID=UPI002613093A|nr:inositol monophosphatase family protein [Maricaulis sp.]MDM7984931.1 inositol monophosphatase family protein [Maricaulis sp.]